MEEGLTKFIESYYYDLVVAFFISITIAFVVMPLLIFVSKSRNLNAKINERSSHTIPTPAIGGVGIFIALFISSLIGLRYNTNSELLFLLGSIVILFTLGILDDINELGSKFKFLIQFIIAFSVAFFTDLKIDTLNGLFGIYEINYYLQIIITVVLIVGIINAYNLIDGINGLAGMLTLINSILLTFIFLSAYHASLSDNLLVYVIISISIAGSVISFMAYNFRSKAMIFMGDTGSLVIGFLMASMAALKMGTIQPVLEDTIFSDSFIFGYSIIFLPVYDTIRVFIERMLKGRSPFEADKTHIHHLLLATGMNHIKATIVISVSQIIMILFVLLIKDILPITVNLLLLTLLGIFLSESLNIKNLITNRKKVNEYVRELKNKNKLLK